MNIFLDNGSSTFIFYNVNSWTYVKSAIELSIFDIMNISLARKYLILNFLYLLIDYI